MSPAPKRLRLINDIEDFREAKETCNDILTLMATRPKIEKNSISPKSPHSFEKHKDHKKKTKLVSKDEQLEAAYNPNFMHRLRRRTRIHSHKVNETVIKKTRLRKRMTNIDVVQHL